MQIVRDERLIQRRKKIGQVTSLLGLGILVVGMAFTWLSPRWDIAMDLTLYATLGTLLVGFILSNVGIYYTNRWGRSPRPDEMLDASLKGLGREYKIYHFVLPVPHVLLTPQGMVVVVTKLEGGTYTVDNDKWRQRFSFMRVLRFIGQEGLGNPTRDAKYFIDRMRKYLDKVAPELVEAPVTALIVFLAENVVLNVGETSVPVVRAAKLKGFLRSGMGKSMPKKTYRQLEELLDSGAGVASQG